MIIFGWFWGKREPENSGHTVESARNGIDKEVSVLAKLIDEMKERRGTNAPRNSVGRGPS